MIERHVYVRLVPEQREEGAFAEVVAQSRALAQLPDVSDLRLLFPADEAALGAWDLCMVFRFVSPAHYQRFSQDPRHRSYVDEFLRPRMQVLKAWNLEE